MVCPICKKELHWDGDAEIEEVGRTEEGIVGFYHCENCNVDIEIYMHTEE